jgi:hypothetical protein
MEKNLSKRIGNISVFPSDNPEEYLYDIVKWYPNVFYGKKDEYEPVPDKPNMYQPKNKDYTFTVDEDVFSVPETNYMVAHITNDPEPDVVTVRFRPWELDSEDQESFKKILEYILGKGLGEGKDGND